MPVAIPVHMHQIKLSTIFAFNTKRGTGFVFMPMESYHDKDGKQQLRGGFPYIARTAQSGNGVMVSPCYPNLENLDQLEPKDIIIVDASDISVLV